MVKAFGNHPSFCAMLYGNEPAGAGSNAYLEKFVSTWKVKDNRRLYSTAAGWPILPVNDFQNDPTPRIQGWGMELKSIINGEAPRTNYDWHDYTSKFDQPFVSHEAKQLLYSLKQYMASEYFKPETETTVSAIQAITAKHHSNK